MVDITRDKPIKVAVRVVVPVRDHPKFNFVGKLLGPKGNSLKRLQEDTMCKMAVLGRGSMKDRHKEEELRASGDPKFQHLSEELHVEISAFATPAEAHARIAYALAEVRRFLVPAICVYDFDKPVEAKPIRRLRRGQDSPAEEALSDLVKKLSNDRFRSRYPSAKSPESGAACTVPPSNTGKITYPTPRLDDVIDQHRGFDTAPPACIRIDEIKMKSFFLRC
ncbi:hypothetical protein FQA39_LY06979 [Lamprigera yunnana]|nr:hypothetical protein FQA39_LY06979 [Lamprigera yunnana]